MAKKTKTLPKATRPAASKGKGKLTTKPKKAPLKASGPTQTSEVSGPPQGLRIKIVVTNTTFPKGKATFHNIPPEWETMGKDEREEYLDEIADKNIKDYAAVDAFIVDDEGNEV